MARAIRAGISDSDSFSKYLWSTYSVPGIVLGGEAGVSKKDKALLSWRVI